MIKLVHGTSSLLEAFSLTEQDMMVTVDLSCYALSKSEQLSDFLEIIFRLLPEHCENVVSLERVIYTAVTATSLFNDVYNGHPMKQMMVAIHAEKYISEHPDKL
jgi:hypothetical protein